MDRWSIKILSTRILDRWICRGAIENLLTTKMPRWIEKLSRSYRPNRNFLDGLRICWEAIEKSSKKLQWIKNVISVIFTWFLLSFYLLKLLVFLYFFWFDLIFIYIYLFICALKEWEDFRLIYKGFTCEVGLGQLNQVNLHPARHEVKRRPTQLNLSPIRARNQRKFAPNPSPIRIRISAYTSVSIFGITFGSDIQLRWFKLGWKFNLKGYDFVVYQKPEFWS